jgi:hypothetical protein
MIRIRSHHESGLSFVDSYIDSFELVDMITLRLLDLRK